MEVHRSINEQLLADTKPSLLMSSVEFVIGETSGKKSFENLQGKYSFLQPEKTSKMANGTCTISNGLSNGSRFSNGFVKLMNGNSHENGYTNGQTNGHSLCLKNDGIPLPKYILCSLDKVQLEWKQNPKIGAGYMNLGNTCFMNSVLQCLTHCPPLVNYLIFSKEDHLSNCKVAAFCMTCELIKHIRKALDNSGDVIKPYNIFQRLKSIAKHFQLGRQEDSHEFLRYVIDGIWRSCVINWEFKHGGTKLDNQSKETTFINQIFGGYHRSQITCLCCKAKSNTYDYFMDFILDIKTVGSLEKALEKFVQPEVLQKENAYKCTKCNKKVSAQKRFTVHRAPNVATFQLKRFDYNRIFGGKITKHISYPETFNLRPYMSEPKGSPITYKLNAVLVHLGSTSNSGHYFCYVRNHNNQWFLMDDSKVSQVNLNHVLSQQAYILFYLRTSSSQPINGEVKTAFPKPATITSENARLTNGTSSVSPLENGLKKLNVLPYLNGNTSKPNQPRVITDEPITNQNKKIDSLFNFTNQEKKTIGPMLPSTVPSIVTAKTNSTLVPYESDDSSLDSQSSKNEDRNKLQKINSNNLNASDNTSKQEEPNEQIEARRTLNKNITMALGDRIVSKTNKQKKEFIGSMTNFVDQLSSLFDVDVPKALQEMQKQDFSFDTSLDSNNDLQITKSSGSSKTEIKHETTDSSAKNKPPLNESKKSERAITIVQTPSPKNRLVFRVKSTSSSWSVVEASKSPSVASGSSSMSGSTTEWQVTNQDAQLKKHFVKRPLSITLKAIEEERRTKSSSSSQTSSSAKSSIEASLQSSSLESDSLDSDIFRKQKKRKRERSDNFLNKKKLKKHKKHKHNRREIQSDHEEVEWVEKTKETLEKEKCRKNLNELDTTSELKNMHLKMYGTSVSTWDGKSTELDEMVKNQLSNERKRSKDDLFNKEYDKGKIKKVKTHGKKFKQISNFDRVYKDKYVNNNKKDSSEKYGY